MSNTTITAPNVTSGDPASLLPKKLVRARPLFDPEIVRRATAASFVKLNPVTLMKNPVMFVVEVGAAMTTLFLIRDIFTGAPGLGFQIQISLWLWFTVYPTTAIAEHATRNSYPNNRPPHCFSHLTSALIHSGRNTSSNVRSRYFNLASLKHHNHQQGT